MATGKQHGQRDNLADRQTGETGVRATGGWAQQPETAKQLAGGAG